MYSNKFDKPYRNINIVDISKTADLFSLVNNMNIQDIKQYVMIEMIPLSVVDKDGNNLIHSVLLNTDTTTKTEQMRLNIVEYLYNENVNPNAMNSKNITPLHIACMKQYYTIVKFLLEKGVDPNYMDNNGNTPFHSLLNGKIKLEEKTEPGIIIPKSKTLDMPRVEKVKELRNDIWEEIKDSPYLQAISNTIENTISSSIECIENVKEFQEELLKQNLSLDMTNNMKNLKELKDISINEFTSTISKQWGNFQRIKDITLHKTDDTSWGPSVGPSVGSSMIPTIPASLSIIENTDIDKYIDKKLDINIQKISKELGKMDTIKIYNINSINKDIYDNKPSNDKLEEYYNGMKHPLALDMADNIIDWENYTFIGGSRAVGIVNEVSLNFILDLLTYDEDVIVKTMAYSLFSSDYTSILNYCNIPANKDKYKFFSSRNEKNIMVRYIVEVIYDNVNLQTESELIEKINDLYKDYTNIAYIINNRRTSDKISWLYHFIISFLCNKGLSETNKNNLHCDINQLLIYLVSSVANNKGNDLRLSISQVLRSRFIKDVIYNNNGFSNSTIPVLKKTLNLGSIYAGWIFILLSENYNINENINSMEITIDININLNIYPNIDIFIDNIDINIANDELKDIIKYTYNLFNNIQITYTKYDMKINESEYLCYMILKYYKNMKQKPLLQNVVDTISLIRFKNTRYKYEIHSSINEYNHFLISSRLLQLYETPLDLNMTFNFTVGILDHVGNSFHKCIDNVLPQYLTEELTDINRIPKDYTLYNFFKNIGYIEPFSNSQKNTMTNDITIESYLLTEYCLPSKLYFYLSQGFNYIDNITNNLNKISDPLQINIYKNNLIIYLLKKIEASHLGLCFMGRLKNLEYNSSNDNDIYFYSHSMNPKITNISRFFTGTYGMAHCCPPTIYQYNNIMDTIYNRMIQIQNKLNSIILKTLENMKLTKKSTTYASVITNLYPVLLGIKSVIENINGMKNLTRNTYINFDMYKQIPDIIAYLIKVEEYNTINIENFNNNINMINSFLYLFYYMKSDDKYKLSIPKFIYNSIGIQPLIAYDNDNDSILYPPQNIIMTTTDNITPPTPKNDNTNIPYIVTSSYNMVIENFNRGIFFMNKDIITKRFVADKKTKLPPSLSNILGEFYKMNTKELIKTNSNLHIIFDNIDDSMIAEKNLQDNIKIIQKYYLGSKITEELIQNYTKLKIKQVAVFLYQSIIQKKLTSIPNNIIVEKLFDDINIDIDIHKNIDSKIFKLNDKIIKNILHNYYNIFTENITKKNVFILYPSNYNNTNLLNSKYIISVDERIIKILLLNRGNIFIHNMENMSPLLCIIKQSNYSILEQIKNLKDNGVKLIDINYKQFTSSSAYSSTIPSPYSPYKYLLDMYNTNINMFMPTSDIKENIKKFVSSQYNEVKMIIQANDSYYNNILINLELSFSICNYLTQQFLIENVVVYKYKFTPTMINYLDTLIDLDNNPQYIEGNDLYYNKIIQTLHISDNDNKILLGNIGIENIKKSKNLKIKLDEYNNELAVLDNTKYPIRYNELILNISKLEEEQRGIIMVNKKLPKLWYNIKDITQPYILDNNKTELITRYDNMLQQMNYARNNYIDGWDKIINNNSRDLFISTKILQEKIDIGGMNLDNIHLQYNIRDSILYYHYINNICTEYFESPRYLRGNMVLNFVYNTLIHLTQNIICSSIENIIKKILFETFNTSYYNEKDESIKYSIIIRKINFIVTKEIKKYLYKEVCEKFVKLAVSIYIDSSEKASYEVLTVTEILSSFIDLMLSESFDKLDNNIIEILKNNIVPYYDTIVNKIILNWNVCIENMFLFMINQYRYIKMIEIIL